MSSPPPSASSPTGNSFTLPQKRPTLSSLVATGPQKRRKPSFASTSSHPLRQTSFPPPGAGSPAYSPSRQSSFSPSVSSFGGRGAGSKKRKQHGRASSQATDAASKAGADGAASIKGADGKADRDYEDPEDEEDLGDGEDTMLEASGAAGAGSKEENENLAMLIDAFTQEQEDRYAAYRRVKLKKEVVRRIVNQTLSQSVPQSIVTTINGYTKVFVGDLVERAREVQAEWTATKQQAAAVQANGANGHADDAAGSGTNGKALHMGLQVEEYDRGPLTPDHLREALRRYKKDREGGSAGFQGLSIQGAEATASRSGGRRLFR